MINNEIEYEKALERVLEIIDINPERNSKLGNELDNLVRSITEYTAERGDSDFFERKLNSYSEHIKNFEEGIIENIINTPDNEILEEVKQEYGDSNIEANIMRKIIQKARKKVDFKNN